MKKNSLVSKILTVVMVIECLFIVVTFLLFCEEYDFGHTWFYEEDSFVYNIKEETYGRWYSVITTTIWEAVRRPGDFVSAMVWLSIMKPHSGKMPMTLWEMHSGARTMQKKWKKPMGKWAIISF